MPLRVLVVTPNYPQPGDPNSGIFIHRQVRELVAQGASCRVVVFRPGPPAFPRWLLRRSWLHYYFGLLRWNEQVDGIPVDVVFYERRWEEGEDVVPAISEALASDVAKNEPPDVVYAHFLWPAGTAALVLRDHGIPVAAIARGCDVGTWLTTNPHCYPSVRRVLEQADMVLANSLALAKSAASVAPEIERPVEVAYNGCSTEVFKPGADRRLAKRRIGAPVDRRLALMCGSVETRKGIAELAAAWEDFSRFHDDWDLTLLGPVVEPPLARQILKAAPGRVRVMGAVDQDRVVAHLQAADLYVQPSRSEGIANATMEAMAVGLPVVATDVGGHAELIDDGDNGLLVPAENPEELCRALLTIASNPEAAKRLGHNARTTISERFDPRREAAKLLSLLSAVADRRPWKRPLGEAATR